MCLGKSPGDDFDVFADGLDEVSVLSVRVKAAHFRVGSAQFGYGREQGGVLGAQLFQGEVLHVCCGQGGRAGSGGGWRGEVDAGEELALCGSRLRGHSGVRLAVVSDARGFGVGASGNEELARRSVCEGCAAVSRPPSAPPPPPPPLQFTVRYSTVSVFFFFFFFVERPDLESVLPLEQCPLDGGHLA